MSAEQQHTPPRWAQRLLEWYCKPELLEDLQGDLNEYYSRNCRSKGFSLARLIYIIDVLKFFRLYLLRQPGFAPSMQWMLYKNYYVTASRNFGKNKLNTVLHVVGLSLGISCFILISLYVSKEFTFDRHYKNANLIYRVTLSIKGIEENQATDVGWADAPLHSRLTENFPEIEAVGSIVKKRGLVKVKIDSHIFQEDNFFDADSSYLKIFSHRWVGGDPQTALKEPGSIVLTEKLARKYFGNNDALNQQLILSDRNYKVTGIIKDLPPNTDLKFDALVSLDSHFPDWCFTYILFRRSEDAIGFQQKLDTLFAEEMRPISHQSNFDGAYHLEPLTDIHLGKKKLFDPPKGDKASLYTFSALSFLVLIISFINYVNLSAAQAVRRQAEVGVRKIFGAMKGHIRTQYIVESLLICLISFSLSLIAVIYLVPTWSDSLLLSYSFSRENLFLILFFIAIIFLMAIVGGWYPVFYLSRSSAIANLKSKAVIGTNRLFRNTLIVVQFTASIALIFSTQVVYDQLSLLSTDTSSFNRDHVLVVDIPDDETLIAQMPLLKNSFVELPFVRKASLVGYYSTPPTETFLDLFGVQVNGKPSVKMINYVKVDEDYFDVLGLQFIEGGRFNGGDQIGDWEGPVVNEALVKSLGWTDPLQESIIYGGANGAGSRVIGVVKDFGFHGLSKATEPMIFYHNQKMSERLLVKVSKSDANSIRELETTWNKHMKGLPFEYRFLDDSFSKQLGYENKFQELMTWFSILSVVIACLGLFGLITISIVQKMRETGIRKIFGANLIHLLTLTWREYVILILVSSALAFPLGFYSMNRWLETFPQKTIIGTGTYFNAVGIICLVVVLTMLYQAIKVSKSDPLKSIKYE